MYEQAPELGRVGGGIAVQSNGPRVLHALGLLSGFERHMAMAHAIVVEGDVARHLPAPGRRARYPFNGEFSPRDRKLASRGGACFCFSRSQALRREPRAVPRSTTRWSARAAISPTARARRAASRLRDSVARFLAVPGGRKYLARVPGVAQAPLDDAALAGVLNWMLDRFDRAHVPAGFAPCSAQEVGRLRTQPLLDAEAVRRRLVESWGADACSSRHDSHAGRPGEQRKVLSVIGHHGRSVPTCGEGNQRIVLKFAALGNLPVSAVADRSNKIAGLPPIVRRGCPHRGDIAEEGRYQFPRGRRPGSTPKLGEHDG